MENANKDLLVIVHYNVVNGGDKRGNMQASTIIYKMTEDEAKEFFNLVVDDRNPGLILVCAHRKQKGEWKIVHDVVNMGNVTYIEWPEEIF